MRIQNDVPPDAVTPPPLSGPQQLRAQISERYSSYRGELSACSDQDLAALIELYWDHQDSQPHDEQLVRMWTALTRERARRTVLSSEVVVPPGNADRAYDVSVIVSTYNSAAFIDECLHDLVHQSIAQRSEIIVIDAASPQDERSIVVDYQQRYPQIRYLRTPQRIGIYEAWNIASVLARGTFITPFSTNDRLSPTAHERLLRTLVDHPQVMLAYGDTHLTQKPHERFDAFTPTHYFGGAFRWPEYDFCQLLTSCLVGPNPMWRAAVHEHIGYFDERYVAIGDQDFFLRVGERFALKHLAEYTGLYWLTEEGLSVSGPTPRAEISRAHFKYQRRNITRLNAEQPNALVAALANELRFWLQKNKVDEAVTFFARYRPLLDYTNPQVCHLEEQVTRVELMRIASLLCQPS
jgi:glycosyltransferase involved in cell wall biosynthesis